MRRTSRRVSGLRRPSWLAVGLEIWCQMFLDGSGSNPAMELGGYEEHAQTATGHQPYAEGVPQHSPGLPHSRLPWAAAPYLLLPRRGCVRQSLLNAHGVGYDKDSLWD